MLQLNVPLVYFADTAHAPYGTKTLSQLTAYFHTSLDLFESQGCAGVVVACNTSSAIVLPHQKGLKLPILGVINAAVQEALAVCRGKLGVLATTATVESGIYQKEFTSMRPEWEIFVRSAPALASLVDKGEIFEESTLEAVRLYLTPLLEEGIDTLLLGCTHYPFLRHFFAQVAGPNVHIVDPAPTVAKSVKDWLGGSGFVCNNANPSRKFWVSDNPEKFLELAKSVLKVDISKVNLLVPGYVQI